MTVRRRLRNAAAALAVAAALGACSSDGRAETPPTTSAPDTTSRVPDTTTDTAASSPTTTASRPTTTPAPTTTLPPDPWTLIEPDGLDLSLAFDARQLVRMFAVGDELFATGTDPSGASAVAWSDDRGATWHQQAIGSQAPNAFLSPEGPALLFGEIGPDQVFRTSRWDRGADGAWAISSTDVVGLTSDQKVVSGKKIYRHGAVGPIHTMPDGAYLSFGSGGFAAPFDTGDRTPFLARSVDGKEWTVTPMARSSLQPVDWVDGPAGPMLVAFDGVGDNRTLRVQRPAADGDVLFEDPLGEGQVRVDTVGGPSAYQLIVSTFAGQTASRVLLRSTDGINWERQPIVFDGITAEFIDVVAGNDEALQLVVSGIATGEQARSQVLITGLAGSFTIEAADEIAHASVRAMVRLADGSLVLLAGATAPTVIIREPIRG